MRDYPERLLPTRGHLETQGITSFASARETLGAGTVIRLGSRLMGALDAIAVGVTVAERADGAKTRISLPLGGSEAWPRNWSTLVA